VEELISEAITPAFRPERAVFSSGGREDMDVRMLGDGRPFVLEMVNPRIVGAGQAPVGVCFFRGCLCCLSVANQ
jgi:tRNA U54 and U55 pseudouridine synthase Pus10